MRAPLPAVFLQRPLAHRALHDTSAAVPRAENAPRAIAAAIAAGYGIEIDVQLSRDGQAMVFHDEDLARLTGQPGALAELRQIALLNGSGDTIPTLAQVLAQVAGRAPLLIEIKDQTGAMAPSTGALERAVARDLAGYAGPVAVMSFNPHSVALMRDLAPAVPRGITTSAYDPADWAPLPAATCAVLREIADYERAACSFISHEAGDLARPRVAQLRAQGAAVLCWTITSPQAEAAARAHAHNITFEQYLPQIPPAAAPHRP
jgi:glycerophosphoryl diester phosphodiesterase